MMNIPVKNTNSLQSIFALCISSANSYIIKIAETTAIDFASMMAWRSDSTKGS